jgi:hypothetical protein
VLVLVQVKKGGQQTTTKQLEIYKCPIQIGGA